MTNSTPEKIEFYKMSGSGNDFIIIDNMDLSLNVGDLPSFARKICQRKISTGADGLVLIEPSTRADFRWRFYNSDGSTAEMCGNAARCVARLAHLKGITGRKMSFETLTGIIHAEIANDVPKVKLTDPSAVKLNQKIIIDDREFALDVVDTGVPHAVNFVEDVASFDVFNWGRKIRYHERFQPKGTNVNFVAVIDRRTLKVRTYERGVENETLACGTGAVATVLVAAQRKMVDSPVDVTVQSGEMLRIYFTRQSESFREIYLEGRVKIVYQGYLFEEAYK